MIKYDSKLKIVSEYDKEIPQSQTADKPVASLGEAPQLKIASLKCYRLLAFLRL